MKNAVSDVINGIINPIFFLEHITPSIKKDNGTIPTNPIINTPFKLKPTPNIITTNIVIIGIKFPNTFFFTLSPYPLFNFYYIN